MRGMVQWQAMGEWQVPRQGRGLSANTVGRRRSIARTHVAAGPAGPRARHAGQRAALRAAAHGSGADRRPAALRDAWLCVPRPA